MSTASLQKKNWRKDLGEGAPGARRRRSGRSVARGYRGLPVLIPGLEAGEAEAGILGEGLHAAQSAIAHKSAHASAVRQKVGKRRARIMRAAQEMRFFPAPGTLPSTPSGQRPPGERPSLAGPAAQCRPRDSGWNPLEPGVRSRATDAGPRRSETVLPDQRQFPHQSDTQGGGRTPKIGQPCLCTFPGPRAVRLNSERTCRHVSPGHRGSGSGGWGTRTDRTPSPPSGGVRACKREQPLEVPRTHGSRASPQPPLAFLPGPRRTPRAACVFFLFPLSASLPPTLRNSSSTCPTGWSTPERLRPHLASARPPPQPPLLSKAKLLLFSCLPEGVAEQVTSPPRRRLRKGVAGRSSRLTPLDGGFVRKSHL